METRKWGERRKGAMSGNGYGARRRRKKEGEERGMRTMSYDIIGDAWVLRETEDDDYKIFIKLFP